MRLTALSLTALALALSGCATPTVVDTKQTADRSLTCAQLLAQIEEAEEFEKKARDDRGMTGTNVAAAVLFWPALIATYSNTEDAIEAAEERQDHLEKLYAQGGC